MAERQPANYTIFCLVVDQNSPFPVEIRPDATVGELKDALKAKKQPEFDRFAADSLTLYLVNLPEDDNLVENVKQKLTIEAPLKATKRLHLLFPGPPADETVHILVQTPGIDPADRLYPRSKIVETLYERLTEHKFIFVRGTPASGKSSLAMLLRKYIDENHPEKKAYLLARYRDEPDHKPIMSWDKWLADQGWKSRNGVLILDEAQLSYGSASRNLLNTSTPLVVHKDQLVGLARGPTGDSVGLLLTREEMEGVVRKSFPNHHFDVSLLDYVHTLTSGHVGACHDALGVVQKDQSYRGNNRGYTYDDFTLNFEMSTFLKKLSDHGVFSRGLPMRDDLEDPKKPFVTNLCEVLTAPSRSVLIMKEDDQRGSQHPLRLCLEQGWLFNEPAGGGKVEYRFASQLHELYTRWLLLRSEDLSLKTPISKHL